jgi:hypothetical protein
VLLCNKGRISEHFSLSAEFLKFTLLPLTRDELRDHDVSETITEATFDSGSTYSHDIEALGSRSPWSTRSERNHSHQPFPFLPNALNLQHSNSSFPFWLLNLSQQDPTREFCQGPVIEHQEADQNFVAVALTFAVQIRHLEPILGTRERSLLHSHNSELSREGSREPQGTNTIPKR